MIISVKMCAAENSPSLLSLDDIFIGMFEILRDYCLDRTMGSVQSNLRGFLGRKVQLIQLINLTGAT